MTAIVPAPFQTFFRLNDGQALDNALAFPVVATEDTITAHSGGTQAAAYQLSATISRITTVAVAADSVALPVANVGLNLWVINDASANAMQVFGNATAGDTINGIATGTGISQPAGTMYQYTCTTAGKWISKQVSDVFTNLTVSGTATIGTAKITDGTMTTGTLTTGVIPTASITTETLTGALVVAAANPYYGTFVNNGVTAVTTANTLVSTLSMVLITLNTPGGTVGAIPVVTTLNNGASFVTKGTASDTSTYNYWIVQV